MVKCPILFDALPFLDFFCVFIELARWFGREADFRTEDSQCILFE